MILYRTSGAWGSGTGANLTAAQVDGNFWDVHTRVNYLELNPPEPVQIASFSAVGGQLYVHMSDSTVYGPLTLPVIHWTYRGPWTAATNYSIDDVVVGPDGAVYLIAFSHTSAATFDPAANDGAGHDYYKKILDMPAVTIPAGGGLGYVLSKNSATSYDMIWSEPQAPPGGFTGQVLQKISATDGDAGWFTLALGSDLGDVAVSDPAGGDFLRWNAGTEQWTNQVSSAVLTSSTWAPVIGDEGTFAVITNGSSDVTILIPADAEEDFPVGTELHIHQDGTGVVTIEGDTTVALHYHSSFTNELLGQYATATVKKTAADEWRLFGLLASA